MIYAVHITATITNLPRPGRGIPPQWLLLVILSYINKIDLTYELLHSVKISP